METGTMKKVKLTDIEPGAVVARPVSTQGGQVMVQARTVLTAEIIGRLANLNVDDVWVEGASPDAKAAEVLLAELDERFAVHEADPLMMDLKGIIAERLRQGATDTRD
jgi:hypothetical protein